MEYFTETGRTILSRMYEDKQPAVKHGPYSGLKGFTNSAMDLETASSSGNIEWVKRLIAHGVSANTFGALENASSNGHLNVVRYLIEHKALVTNKALQYACDEGHVDVVKILVENGASVTADYSRALHYVSDVTIAKYLVEKGACATEAIGFASERGDLEVVKYLIENKADITANQNHALRRASAKGYYDVVEYLLTHSPKESDITYIDDYSVDHIRYNGYFKVINLLLSHGVDFSHLSRKNRMCFIALKAFRRWRQVIFRRFFRKVVIPLYYSPGFPGADTAKKELADSVHT